jgi:hypothetical protein
MVRTRKDSRKSVLEREVAKPRQAGNEDDGTYVCLTVILSSCKSRQRLRQLKSAGWLGVYALAEHSRGTDLVLLHPIDKSRTVPSMRVQSKPQATETQEPPRARFIG